MLRYLKTSKEKVVECMNRRIMSQTNVSDYMPRHYTIRRYIPHIQTADIENEKEKEMKRREELKRIKPWQGIP